MSYPFRPYGALSGASMGASIARQDQIAELLAERKMRMLEEQALAEQEYRSRDLSERTRLREAQQAETARLNSERAEDREERRKLTKEARVRDRLRMTPTGAIVDASQFGELSEFGDAHLFKKHGADEHGQNEHYEFGGTQEALANAARLKADQDRYAHQQNMDQQRFERQQRIDAARLALDREKLQWDREKGNQPSAKPATGAERTAVNFLNRMIEAERNARKVEDQIGTWDSVVSDWAPNLIENYLKSDAGQQYTQAQRMFTEARLRKDSGAAVPPSEYETDRITNFLRGGDKPDVRKAKRGSRLAQMRGVAQAAGRALADYYGEGATIDSLLSEFADAPEGTVKLRAPNGQVKEVPAADADRYIKAGAQKVN